MHLQGYDYCYLNYVLTDDSDKTVGFSFILSDKSFNNIAILNTDKTGLLELVNNDEIIKDFFIDNNFLKCSPVKRVIITKNDVSTFNSLLKLDNTTKTFTDFIKFGVENEFILLSSDFDEKQENYKFNFTSFSNIQVAQTTMSVYAKIFDSNNGLHNEMLVFMDKNKFVVNDFLFGVKELFFEAVTQWFSDAIQFSIIGKYIINNENYYVCKMESVQLFKLQMALACPLINKAMTLRVKYKSIIGVLKGYVDTLYVANPFNISDTSDKIEWVGGNESYANSYGVYLKSATPALTAKQIDSCLGWYADLVSQYDSTEAIFDEIDKHTNKFANTAVKYLITITEMGDSVSSNIINCNEAIDSLKKSMLLCDLWLYDVRVYSYMRLARITPISKPKIEGSDEDNYTTVDSKFYYGE